MIYTVGGSDGTNLCPAECYNTHWPVDNYIAVSSISKHRKYPGAATIGGKIYAVDDCGSAI